MKDETGLLANGFTFKQVWLEHVRPIIVAFVRYVGPYDTLLDKDSPMSVLGRSCSRGEIQTDLSTPTRC